PRVAARPPLTRECAHPSTAAEGRKGAAHPHDGRVRYRPALARVGAAGGAWWTVPRVLVVDDDADVRELLHDAFTAAGYAVDLAGDGKTALEALKCACPDVAVVDLLLPLLDGWHVVRAAH